jgi:hypothetical protein
VVSLAERADYMSPDFLKRIAALDPVELLPRLTSTRLRVQLSLWDSGEIPVASRQRIAEAVPAGADLAQYRDMQDYWNKAGSNGKMLDWMHTALTPGADGLKVTPETGTH